MRRKTRPINVLRVLLLTMALVLSACGGGNGGTGGQTTASPAAGTGGDAASPAADSGSPAASPADDTAASPAAGTDSSAGGEQGTATINISLSADPPNLDPARSTALVDRQVFASIFDKLVDLDAEGQIVPMLATEWDVSEDGLVYTFTLREGVKFHDGTDFNAEAVKFSMERGMEEASPRRGELAAIESIEAVDEHTVEVTLKQPFAPFLSVLTDRAGMIVSPTAAQEAGEDFLSNPIGSGPFKFESRQTGTSITLVRNEDYWQEGLPKAERIVYKVFTDPNTAIVNLRSGQVDMTDTVPSREAQALQNENNFAIVNEPGFGYQGIWLNTRTAPLDNQNVRQAISMLIDREALVRVVFQETAIPGNSPFAPAHFVYGVSDEVSPPDVEGAKQLLADAGVSNVSFTMKTTTAAVNVQLAQLLKNFLQAGGINMEIEQLEFGTLLEQLDTGNYEAAQVGWSGRPDPDGNIYNFMTTGSSNNYAGYSNPTVDELLNTARTELDEDARKEAYDQVMEILHEEVPYVYLYHQNNVFGMTNAITGFTYVPDGIIRTIGLDKQ